MVAVQASTIDPDHSVMGERKTVCLCMIVKNEAHLIVNTLKHLSRYIKFDYWAINDNGSTDGTQNLIRNYFKGAGISGELDETPWRDFAYNRTVAFNVAFGKTDYVFVWDADDEISGDFQWPTDLTADSYMFTYGNADGHRYSRCQLFNNRLRWKYVGVIHEYPTHAGPTHAGPTHAGPTPGPQGTVTGNYYFVSGRTGARNRDPEKYLKDALVLERAFDEAVAAKDGICSRYAFYTAQSYNCCNRHEKAIEYYKKVLTLDNWAQEKYVSCFEIYEQYALLKREEEGLRFLVEGHRFDTRRIECIYRLIKHYCIAGLPAVSMAYYTLIQKYFENEYLTDNIATRLFAKKSEYDFFLPYYMIIVSGRVSELAVAQKMYRMIFRQGYCAGTWWIHNLFNNLQFSIPSGDADFVEAMLAYVEMLRLKGIVLKSEHYIILDRVVAANRPALVAAPCKSITPRTTTPVRVMLTVTTCKRRDLFEQTINSMLRTWTDISAVDYFFCVDDNSSAEDRLAMRAQYPFFDYYMKTPAEKGHRESMNIIWNKLKQVQPTYWVHMEDDWMYFKQENYIGRGIALLEKYESHRIHQLVFNREYGLMLADMDRVSGALLEPGVWLHTQTPVEGKNCAYWPHYSIQPSIIRTRIILELGNYDSANAFFERDYANKYGAAGYKTMFFDGIYSLHIGKQHWEKEGKNAYALNEVGQFAPASVPKIVISEIVPEVMPAEVEPEIEPEVEAEVKQEVKPELKNLLYMSVFGDGQYIELLKILMLTIKYFSKTDTFDILVLTSEELVQKIQELSELIHIPIKTHVAKSDDLHEMLCARYTIFEYKHIDKYARILYIDTDIIVQNDLTPLFSLELENKIYALSEGTIEHEYHGGWYFDFTTIDKNIPGMNSGILLFNNSEEIRKMFNDILAHQQSVQDKNEPIPSTGDQPFLNYHAIKNGLQETTLLDKYAVIYCMTPPAPPSSPTNIILCHFVWPLGNAGHKKMRMIQHMNHIFNHYAAIYATVEPDINPLVGRSYTWGDGRITFEAARLVTTWGIGKYKWLDTHTIEVSWSCFSHVLRMSDDYTSFISVRTRDFDCVVGKDLSIMIRAVTPTNTMDDSKLHYLLGSTKILNIKLDIIGVGKKFSWLERINWLRDYLRSLPTNEKSITCITDAFDVFYLDDLNVIKHKFLQFNCDIVFSAEKKYSFQLESDRPFYDNLCDVPFGYKYFNAGTYIGYTHALLEMLNDLLDISLKDDKFIHDFIEANYYPLEKSTDQGWISHHICKHWNKYNIKIDYQCKIFYLPVGDWDNIDKYIDGKMKVITGNTPSIIHVPWIAKYEHILKRLYDTKFNKHLDSKHLTMDIYRLSQKNLVYTSVFYKEDYVELFKIMMLTIKFCSKTDTIDFLVMTSDEFAPLIADISKITQIPIRTKIMCVNTIAEATCSRLYIFDYEHIALYNKILFIDTDIIVQNDLTKLFEIDIEDKVYAVEEGIIESEGSGGWFFDFTTIDKQTPAMNAGIMLFNNTWSMRKIFAEINMHMQEMKDANSRMPAYIDQAFLNYHLIKNGKYDIKLLCDYAKLCGYNPPPPPSSKTDVILCHFAWPLGNAPHKKQRMINHMNHVFNNYTQIYGSDASGNPLLGKKFRWGNSGAILFADSKLITTWAVGTYKWLDAHTVEATWASYSHVLRMNGDYTEFISIRKRDFDCTHGTIIVNDGFTAMIDTILKNNLSMTSRERMTNLYNKCIAYRDTGYSFVECGVAKGGCLAIMKSAAGDNNIFGFDSFEGMPDITEKDIDYYNKSDPIHGFGKPGDNLSGGIDSVFNTFATLKLDMKNVHLIKGFFADTLNKPENVDKIGIIAVLRLDGDWYESTKVCLEKLYDKVIDGGVVIIDDYGHWVGAKNAVDEFRRKNQIESPLIKTDYTEHYWIKNNISTIFDNRDAMMKHYCNMIGNPTILEIGVFKGDYLGYIVDNCKVGSIDAVDLFEGVGWSGNADGNNVVYYDIGKSYIELINKYKGRTNIRLHKSDSSTFLRKQEDNYYDIIYIDGDHSYNGVKKDLENAINKIKHGGYIMGHDYEMNMMKTKHVYEFGVKRAVDEFCITYKQTICAKAMDGCVSYCIKMDKHNVH